MLFAAVWKEAHAYHLLMLVSIQPWKISFLKFFFDLLFTYYATIIVKNTLKIDVFLRWQHIQTV